MRLLITGSSGFIGSAIAQKAVSLGHEVIGVSVGADNALGIERIHADLTVSSDYVKLPGNVDAILHLAGQSSVGDSLKNPVADLKSNTVSTLNLIAYGIKAQATKFIYASSTAVYGNADNKAVSESDPCLPVSCYGVGKLASEDYLNVYKSELPYMAFRMFNVYGPGCSLEKLRRMVIGIYFYHAIKGGHIPVAGSFDRYRDFIYIDDVVDIWMQALELNDMPNQAINLGTGVKTTIGDVLKGIQTLMPQVTVAEMDGTPGDQFGIYADLARFNRIFGARSYTSFEEGLASVYQWACQVIR